MHAQPAARAGRRRAGPASDRRSGSGRDREVILVPGNHDAPLIRAWARRRAARWRRRRRSTPTRHAALARVVVLAGARARSSVSYPGVWLGDASGPPTATTSTATCSRSRRSGCRAALLRGRRASRACRSTTSARAASVGGHAVRGSAAAGRWRRCSRTPPSAARGDDAASCRRLLMQRAAGAGDRRACSTCRCATPASPRWRACSAGSASTPTGSCSATCTGSARCDDDRAGVARTRRPAAVRSTPAPGCTSRCWSTARRRRTPTGPAARCCSRPAADAAGGRSARRPRRRELRSAAVMQLAQDQVAVAELVPQVAVLERRGVGALAAAPRRRSPRASAGARPRARASR